MQKIVMDTNEFIFSILSARSYSAEIMHMVLSERITLYVSKGILHEYERVLAYEKFKLPASKREKVLCDIRELCVMAYPRQSSIAIRDEDDRIFYDTATQSGAILITSDKDLLVLGKSFIMTSEEYMTIYRAQSQQ